MSSGQLPKYVLITPARNEAAFIELTIQSMIAQAVLPLRWVIVSDGSTDGTDQIVKRYTPSHPWIHLIRMPERKDRHFAGKVLAFQAGLAEVAGLDFEVVGNLDADTSFEPGHFEYLMTQFARLPRLGCGGSPFTEGGKTYDFRFTNIEHVWGGCQLFRRECFSEIGGYIPVKTGAIDHIAVTTARMKGWQTRTFTDSVVFHHRRMGTAQKSELMARFRAGAKDYSVGNHPLWQVTRVLYQMTKKPRILGGAALGAGYAWSMLRQAERPVSRELIQFTRREQMKKLRDILTSGRVGRTTVESAR